VIIWSQDFDTFSSILSYFVDSINCTMTRTIGKHWHRNWFLNSALVFSSAKSINRARIDTIYVSVQKESWSLQDTFYLHFVRSESIASHICLISHMRVLCSQIFDSIVLYFKIGFPPKTYAFRNVLRVTLPFVCK